MSADDFQNKYASVMESMLRSAVAETTKLFETMVDELKEEISSIRRENEELKIRCSRFEKTENEPAVHVGAKTTSSGPSVSSKKRDSCVQCDLVNLPTVPAEICQPLQDHQYSILTDSQMRFSSVQPEEDSSSVCSESELEEAEVEHFVVSKPAPSDGTVEASVRGRDEQPCNEGCSTEKLMLSLTGGKRRGSVLGEITSLQQDKNKPTVLEQSPSTNTDKEPETASKMSETKTQGELETSEKLQKVTRQCQRGRKTLSKKNDASTLHCTKQKLQKSFELNQEDACEEVKKLPVQRRRRAPTKTKRRKTLLLSSSDCPSDQEDSGPPSIRDEHPEKSSTFDSWEILLSESPQTSPDQPNGSSSAVSFLFPASANTAVTDLNNTIGGPLPVSGVTLSCLSGQQKPSESKQPVMEVEEQPTPAGSTENAFGVTLLLQASEQLREKETCVCCQDSPDTVKTTSQSLTSLPKTSSFQTAQAATKKKNEIPVNQQTRSPSAETPFSEEICDFAPQFADAVSTGNASDQVAPEQQHALPAFELSEPPLAAVATETVQSQSQLISAILTPNKLNTVSSRTIIIIPRTKYFHFQNSSVSDNELSIVPATTAQSNLQPSETLVSTSEKTLPPSDLPKTIIHTYKKLLPVVSFLSSSTSKVQQPVTYPSQQGKASFQQKVLALASRQSQMNMQRRQQIIELPVLISKPSTQLKPTSVGSSAGASNDTSPKLENLKTAAPEIVESPSNTCSESNVSAKPVPASILFVPPNAAENLSPVVRLARLPLSVTTCKSISVSRLLPNGSSKCTPVKQSVPPVSFSEVLTLSSNMSPTGSARTPSNGSEDNLQILDQSNIIQDQASLPLESSSVFSQTPSQPSTSSSVSVPALVESNGDGNAMEHSSIPTLDEEPAPNHCEGMTSNKVQENKFGDILQLVPIKTRDPSHPHSRMTKSQFLAQLAVLPKNQAQDKAISTGAGNRASYVSSIREKSLQKNHFLSRLRSYHKAYILTKRAATKLKASTPSKASPIRLRKRRLSDVQKYETATTSKMSVCPKKQVVLEYATNTTPCEPSPIDHVNKGRQSKDGVTPETSVCEAALISFGISGENSDDAENDSMDTQEHPMGTPERPVSPELSPSPNQEHPMETPERPLSFELSPSPNQEHPMGTPERPLSLELSPSPNQEHPMGTSERPVSPELSPSPNQEHPLWTPERPVSPELSPSPNQEHPLWTPERPVSPELSPSPKRPKLSSLLRSTSSRDDVTSENESISEILTTGSSAGESAGNGKTQEISVSPSRPISGEDGAPSKESSSVSPTWSTSGEDGACSEKSSSVSLEKSTSGGDRLHSEESCSSSPRRSTSGEDVARSKEASSVSPKRSTPGGESACCKESSSVSTRRATSGGDGAPSKESSSMRSKRSTPGGDGAHCRESSSVSSRRSTSGGDRLRSKECSSVSPRRSKSGQSSLRCKDSNSVRTRSTSVCVKTRRSTSGRTPVCSKESSTMSLRRSTSGRDDVRSKKSSCGSSRGRSRGDDGCAQKSSPVSLERSSSTSKSPSCKKAENVATPKGTKSFLMSHRRLSMETTRSEKNATACTGSTASGLTERSTSLKLISRCNSTSSTDGPEKESSSVSVERCSVTRANVTKRAVSDIGSTSVSFPEVDENGRKSPNKAETDTAKEANIDDDPTSEKSFEKSSTWTLAGTNVARTVAEIKNWKNTKLEVCMLQHRADSELKRWKTKGVWIPPTLPQGEVPHGDIEKMEKSKNDSKNASPKPKPVRPVGIVSPLQPLLVIGKFTLRNQCGQCGRTFNNNVALENHVSLHKKRRPFSCSLCGKSFPDSRAFKRHDRVHRNGKIHICPECGKGFVYNFYLTKHLQMVHSTVRSVFCPICNKGFFSQREVDVHVRTHTGEKPFPCNLCERKFSTRVKLNVHLRWHKGEKRHWCTFCSKGFLDYNNLKRHTLVHTGEKPYPCPLCSKCFTQTGHLKKHVANVHKAK